jgi:hypothetical protein
LNLLPQFIGRREPSFIFCIKTTLFKMPGTAAEATAPARAVSVRTGMGYNMGQQPLTDGRPNDAVRSSEIIEKLGGAGRKDGRSLPDVFASK